MIWRIEDGLRDRSVVVTGAAGGIGAAIAHAAAEAGAVVVAVDLPTTPLTELVASLAGTSSHVAVAVDLADLTTHESIFAQAVNTAPLAGLIHAAGVIRRDSIDNVTEEDFDLQVGVNLKSTFFVNRACWRVLRESGGGAIVNFASQGWWTGGFGGSVVYSASKGGVVSLTRGLARSFASDGVRVNALAPGLVDTAMMREGVDEAMRAAFIDMIPLGRLGTPEEMTGAALFLLSEASGYITGALLNVSGGQLMY